MLGFLWQENNHGVLSRLRKIDGEVDGFRTGMGQARRRRITRIAGLELPLRKICATALIDFSWRS